MWGLTCCTAPVQLPLLRSQCEAAAAPAGSSRSGKRWPLSVASGSRRRQNGGSGARAARAANIPGNPHTTCRHDGWQGHGHWLGTGAVASQSMVFLPFKEALVVVRSLQLKSTTESEAWKRTGARPANVPGNPGKTCRHHGWQGCGHWLGTGTVATFNMVFLPFEEALAFVRSLRLKNQTAWYAWKRLKGDTEWRTWRNSGARPTNVPTRPDRVNDVGGWQGWGY